MLKALPFPKELSKVVEYAGAHHERIDGKGYPNGLTGDQMSIPAKIMAIADIFEALTANDRPYKEPKKLSEVLSTPIFTRFSSPAKFTWTTPSNIFHRNRLMKSTPMTIYK